MVALVGQAAVKIPCGLALFALAGWIVWKAGDIVIADLFAAWLAYDGGTLVFGSLEGFVSREPQNNPPTREGLRRSNIPQKR